MSWTNAEHLGGTFTVYSFGQSGFNRAAPFLILEDRRRFSDGSKGFREIRSAADPLPTQNSNAPSCEACHFRNGRGLAHADTFSDTGFAVTSQLGHVSVFRNPTSPKSVATKLERVVWHAASSVVLADGTAVELVVPTAIIDGKESAADLRNAPGIYGLGLIEAIPDSAIRTLAQTHPYSRVGIKGIAAASETSGKIGRFGWKGRFSSLKLQVRDAIASELGIPARPSTSIGFNNLEASLTSYMQLLAVPARRLTSEGAYRGGAQIFAKIGCQMCHRPTWRTASSKAIPELFRDQVIHPFTDLLLHDMGEQLRDSNGNELSRFWRTPPLWGIGMQKAVSDKAGFLHDGRARNITEAILWHKGEAAASAHRFEALSTQERQALLEFLSSL